MTQKENNTDYDSVIDAEHQKEITGITMHLKNIKETPVAQIFEVGIYKFLIQFAIGIALLVGGYYVIVDRIDDNEMDIGINVLYGKETRNITNKHIEDTKGDPLSEQALTNKVVEMEKDVGTNTLEVKRISDIQIGLAANQKTLVDNNTRVSDAVVDIKEDVGKIKGKLDID